MILLITRKDAHLLPNEAYVGTQDLTNKTDYLSLHETKSFWGWKLRTLVCPNRNDVRTLGNQEIGKEIVHTVILNLSGTLDNQEVGRRNCLYCQFLTSLVFHYLKIQLLCGHEQSY